MNYNEKLQTYHLDFQDFFKFVATTADVYFVGRYQKEYITLPNPRVFANGDVRISIVVSYSSYSFGRVDLYVECSYFLLDDSASRYVCYVYPVDSNDAEFFNTCNNLLQEEIQTFVPTRLSKRIETPNKNQKPYLCVVKNSENVLHEDNHSQ
jgi:hypothetical protein